MSDQFGKVAERPLVIFIFIFRWRRFLAFPGRTGTIVSMTPTWRASTGATPSREHERMFGLESQPLGTVHAVWTVCAMVELSILWDVGYEERHAVMVQGRSELAHGAVDGVEDVIGILSWLCA